MQNEPNLRTTNSQLRTKNAKRTQLTVRAGRETPLQCKTNPITKRPNKGQLFMHKRLRQNRGQLPVSPPSPHPHYAKRTQFHPKTFPPKHVYQYEPDSMSRHPTQLPLPTIHYTLFTKYAPQILAEFRHLLLDFPETYIKFCI